MNIILIGMPGCGKSTIGVLLAKAIQFGFVDCDLLIQRRCSMSLQSIIDTQGLDRFLNEEESTIVNFTDDNCVVATGGSAVYSQKAMEHLKKNGIVVYLSLPLEDIESRLTNIKTRGVAMTKSQTIGELYKERCPLYEKYADITVKTHNLNIEQTVEKIAESIKNFI
ncbi:MAG: shikimate kinase [Clostridia bacterium]|nr:shikimate kinase [Clostridia bacterium]